MPVEHRILPSIASKSVGAGVASKTRQPCQLSASARTSAACRRAIPSGCRRSLPQSSKAVRSRARCSASNSTGRLAPTALIRELLLVRDSPEARSRVCGTAAVRRRGDVPSRGERLLRSPRSRPSGRDRLAQRHGGDAPAPASAGQAGAARSRPRRLRRHPRRCPRASSQTSSQPLQPRPLEGRAQG